MRVALVSRDLMDRSRITSAVQASGGTLVAPEEADVVLADLRQVTPDQIRSWASTSRVIAFGPHVDTGALAAAEEAGAEALPRSRFFPRLADLLG